MEMGRRGRYSELVARLGRAAGLSTLALATLASGPCGPCTTSDDCATIDELLATREAGIEEADTTSSAGSSSAGADVVMNVETAKEWGGKACPTPAQYEAIVSLKLPSRYADGSLTATELVSGKCCYHYVGEDCSQGGRPFLVHGAPRVASVTRHTACTTEWLADALMEHASVAAFARLSLHLLALGAPAELVRDAQLASLDELRHAEVFFQLASEAAGTPLRPGALNVAGALDDTSLAGLIEQNLREGCIGETRAAEDLRRRAESVASPTIKASLLTIVEDETRHAELAFRILAWCLDAAPELTRQTIERVLTDEQQRWYRDAAWQNVISPVLRALC
jgi:hypothetical protein